MRNPRIVLLLVVLALTCLAIGRAAALEPAQQGWWTSAHTGLPTDQFFAPDVPSDGLLVQGGLNGPTAFAALVYQVPLEVSAQALTLTIESGAVNTTGSTLALCPLNELTINAEQAGPMSDAPSYDCAAPVTAVPDGDRYRFDMSSLVSLGTLAVAILPTSERDRVVFSHPDAESLSVEAVSVTTDTTAPPIDPDPVGPPPTTTAMWPGPPMPAPAAVPPLATTATPSTAGAAPQTIPAPPPALVPTAGEGNGDADPLAVTLALAGVALGGGFWLSARRAARQLGAVVELAWP